MWCYEPLQNDPVVYTSSSIVVRTIGAFKMFLHTPNYLYPLVMPFPLLQLDCNFDVGTLLFRPRPVVESDRWLVRQLAKVFDEG